MFRWWVRAVLLSSVVSWSVPNSVSPFSKVDNILSLMGFANAFNMLLSCSVFSSRVLLSRSSVNFNQMFLAFSH